MATPSSANLASALTDETGTGSNVFATSPTINTATVTTPSAASIPLITKGAASQTANLQEWQNSAGTAVASIDLSGQLRTPQILNTTSFNNSRLQMTATGALFDVGVTTNVVLRVKGAASQTANLQEWQDSAGTVLAKVTAAGSLVTTSTYTAKTAAYTFASGDEGQLFSMNNAATQQFNIPTDATFNFAVGTEINVFWITGAGQPSIGAVTPGTTTVISTGAVSATPLLRVANSGATCKKLAANSWIVFGDLA